MATQPTGIPWCGRTACARLNKNQCGPVRPPHRSSWKCWAEWGWTLVADGRVALWRHLHRGLFGSRSWFAVPRGGCADHVLTVWVYELLWSSWEAVNSHQPHQLPFVEKPSSLLQHLFGEQGEQCALQWRVVSLHLKRLLHLGWKAHFKSTKVILIIKVRIGRRWELMWALTIILIGFITTYRFVMGRK